MFAFLGMNILCCSVTVNHSHVSDLSLSLCVRACVPCYFIELSGCGSTVKMQIIVLADLGINLLHMPYVLGYLAID